MTGGPEPRGEAPPTYRETMPLPLAIWVVALALWALFALALGVTLGPWVGVPLLVAGSAGLVVGLHAARGQVKVGRAGLSAGRATLPPEFTGPVTTLDATAARVLRGTGADPRAYLYLRSWVAAAVRVEVADPADPTPYWYVSTRQPDRLATAIEAARSSAPEA